jgi:sterol desaturase/sphingolipid hydroxylase (fatty acid hydroxylase superfamily)
MFEYGLGALVRAIYSLLLPALFFTSLALLLRGREALAAAHQAREEVRINLWLHVLDVMFILPVTALLVTGIAMLLGQWNLVLVDAAFWAALGVYPVLFLAVFLGDFIGYWRHRLEHTHLLWPSHAIHHSDTEVTWLTLARFHPINRLVTTAVDSAFLLALGLPAWAIVANNVVRHYYGYFIHADLPWTYGRLGAVFVSPAMHRWHHARELRYAGTNFATVFSVFDRAFGTLSVPGPCNVALGVEVDMGRGVRGQLAYPLRVWFQPLFQQLSWTRASGKDAPARGMQTEKTG